MADFQDFTSTLFDLDSLNYLTAYNIPEIDEIPTNQAVQQIYPAPQALDTRGMCELPPQEYSQTQNFCASQSYPVPANHSVPYNYLDAHNYAVLEGQNTAQSYQTSYKWDSSQDSSAESSDDQIPNIDDLMELGLEDFLNYHPDTTESAVSTANKKRRVKRIRTAYTTDQLYELETSFRRSSYLSKERRAELMVKLRLSSRQLKIWFQNRRMKEKRTKGARFHYTPERSAHVPNDSLYSSDESTSPPKKSDKLQSLSQHSDVQIRNTLLAYTNFNSNGRGR